MLALEPLLGKVGIIKSIKASLSNCDVWSGAVLAYADDVIAMASAAFEVKTFYFVLTEYEAFGGAKINAGMSIGLRLAMGSVDSLLNQYIEDYWQ